MGEYINNTNFGKYDLEDMYNARSGVVSFFIEMSNEFAQPDVFVTVAKSADIEHYGFSNSYYSNGSGAALTAKAARYAGIGETLERYCLSLVHPEDLVLSTHADLVKSRSPTVGPGQWSLFSDDQDTGPFPKFEEDTLIAWVQADSLMDKQTKYVPATLTYLPYYRQFQEQGEKIITVSVSTGASCATSLNDAIFKGICELVERDSFMINWRNRLPCPKICIDEKSRIYETYISNFMRPGLKYDIYYTTLDLGIPSFWGVLSGTDDGINTWHLVGGAAHPDPETAVLKTLVELGQGLAWKDYKGDGSFPIVDGFTNVDSFEKRLELYVYNDMTDAFKFLPRSETINLSDIKKSHGFNGKNVDETLQNIIKDFSSRQYDILAVDMTSPETYEAGAFVVKVLIPALEVMDGDHRFQYLGGTRWKEVPAKLGLDKSNLQSGPNPYPHPYP